MTKFEIAAVKARRVLHRLVPGNGKRPFSSVVLTAAGSGERMGGVCKALFPLNGKPCIRYSLELFQDCDFIDEIIITVRKEDRPAIEKFLSANAFQKVKTVVLGGSTRQESVKNGFLAISKESELVWIHDAARPALTKRDLDLLYKTVCRRGAATASNTMTDTVKRTGKGGVITETVPRMDLVTVQTPQVFRTDLYRVALAYAEKDGIEATDDCSLAQHAGFSVYPCETSRENLKLTTPDNAPTLERILKEKDS